MRISGNSINSLLHFRDGSVPQDYGSEVRGCHAKEAIVNDEIIIEVPLKCLITVEMGKETEVTGFSALIVFVLYVTHFHTGWSHGYGGKPGFGCPETYLSYALYVN